LDIIQFPKDIIEWLIPITILLTAAYNLFTTDKTNKLNVKYISALLFGLIHGMGFSNFLKSALMPGEEHLLVWQLLAFNLGIEIGQLLIVGAVLLVNFIVLNILGLKKRNWIILVNIVVMILCTWIITGLLK
jgi:amino acid transporter